MKYIFIFKFKYNYNKRYQNNEQQIAVYIEQRV